jgi:aryl-alcohol dehydrogenase-like predicted oxidoreductase
LGALETRQLGNSDIEITRLGFGSWAIGGGDWIFGWGDQDPGQAVDAIVAAVDSGINWIDTAPVYGGGVSETIVGQAIKALGPARRPVVATKCGRVMKGPSTIDKVLKKESVFAECEASLRRLQIDCIDLYQLHWPEPNDQIEEGWEALVELKQQGKVRQIGVSNHDVSQMERLAKIHPLCSLQPPYSMLKRDVEREILPYCLNNQIGVVSYSPLAKGLLTGSFNHQRVAQLDAKDHRSRDPQFQSPLLDAHLGLVDCLRDVAGRNGLTLAQLAIAWVLRRPEITAAIVGARSPSQIAEILSADNWSLPDQQWMTVDQLLAGHSIALQKASLYH